MENTDTEPTFPLAVFLTHVAFQADVPVSILDEVNEYVDRAFAGTPFDDRQSRVNAAAHGAKHEADIMASDAPSDDVASVDLIARAAISIVAEQNGREWLNGNYGAVVIIDDERICSAVCDTSATFETVVRCMQKSLIDDAFRDRTPPAAPLE